MKEFMITKKEAGVRMDKYLFKILTEASAGFIFKMLRKKNIVLNEKKATGKEVLQADDHIKIYLSDETFAKFAPAFSDSISHTNDTQKNLKTENQKTEKSKRQNQKTGKPTPEIIYEDEDILIINKPAGLLSQKAAANDYSANEMILDYLLDSGQISTEELRTFRPSICNRLDRNTSGLLIAGKTMHGLQEMAEQLKSRSMQKFYRCIVKGCIKEDAHLSGYLIKDHGKNQVTVTKQPSGSDASPIETAYHPVKVYDGCTLLEVHLITGRSHQIRAHLASIGHPILGDTKYGDAAFNQRFSGGRKLPGQLLHAYRMEFPDGKIVVAKEPKIFSQILKNHKASTKENRQKEPRNL